MKKDKVAVVIGPTASGKTDLSIYLAKKLNGEVISGDSMQIYRGLSIGTAKATKEEMAGVPHHLIDIKNPDESFSAAEFQLLAREKIADINARGKLPIICGGTGLYIQSVLYDYEFGDDAADASVRKQIEEEAERLGPEAIHDQLKAVDPETAAAFHPNNVRRTIRALEIYRLTGEPASKRKRLDAPDEKYDAAIVGITLDRPVLYERINRRVDAMIESGLLDEAKWLYSMKLDLAPAVQAIGYKELFPYLRGEQTLQEAADLLKQNSRRYAKRQLTWFRNKMELDWFDLTIEDERNEKKQQICSLLAGKLNLR
ncbi:tRNA (adenosine(37)-N6)-dimethylallyltransferase MiaA [Domibacillus enclensis]|uniref:tRNA dimethylallyltransferase n=1 Tax=Domibacillus enclensis TaxID=1017273 RepID=A0A1N6UV73_9BACI|nr:tRNA (adenosine(37)-N6)-dimethylallyltransferase MiaA [Domibacillus enclensis]OXS78631.1 tRNA dimethylallyltransferase [Domibacillus enclensis]SIQ69489.1 tRNA dimethylallyltransferase [Domibacillus enclensis]